MENKLNIFLYLIKYYSSNWKEAFLKAATNNWMDLYLAIYWIIFPIDMVIGMEEKSTFILSVLFYYSLFLPLILGQIHAVMFPNGLDKTMFLCPIGQKEKRLFLIFGYFFRFSCVCFSSFIILFFMMAAGFLKFSIYLILFFLSEVMFAAIIFLITYTEASKKNGDYIWLFAAWLVNMIFCLFLGNIIWEYKRGQEPDSWSKSGWLLFTIILFIIQLFFFLKVMVRCWKKEMEIAMDYEKSYSFYQEKEKK